MRCNACGNELPEGVLFCNKCGTKIDYADVNQSAAGAGYDYSDNGNGGMQYEQPVYDYNNNYYNGTNNNAQSAMGGTPFMADGPLKTNRGLAKYIVLNMITCGIYGLFVLHGIGKDLNVLAAGDNEETPGIFKLILLNMLTCGIYSYFWYFKVGNRMHANAERYGLYFEENGTTYLAWFLAGSMTCGIGSFIAIYYMFKNMNALCGAYNYYCVNGML